jgi:hypothetical protein
MNSWLMKAHVTNAELSQKNNSEQLPYGNCFLKRVQQLSWPEPVIFLGKFKHDVKANL